MPALALLLFHAGCGGPALSGGEPAASASVAPPPPSPSTALSLLAVRPPSGSLVETQASLRLEFDRPLDPRSLTRALTFDYPDPGVIFLAEPFRHVGLRLEEGGRILVVEPPELLVGREVRAHLSADIRGLDGSAPSLDMPRELTYRVMELPP